MTQNISMVHILRTQDLTITIMTGYTVHSRTTVQAHQAARLRRQVPLQAVRPRHQDPLQAVRPRHQDPLQGQLLLHVRHSRYKNGIHAWDVVVQDCVPIVKVKVSNGMVIVMRLV